MVSGDEEVKLLLEAFQMSVSACLSHPQTPVLRAQMLGRLMAVQLSRSVKVTLLCWPSPAKFAPCTLILLQVWGICMSRSGHAPSSLHASLRGALLCKRGSAM